MDGVAGAALARALPPVNQRSWESQAAPSPMSATSPQPFPGHAPRMGFTNNTAAGPPVGLPGMQQQQSAQQQMATRMMNNSNPAYQQVPYKVQVCCLLRKITVFGKLSKTGQFN